MLDEGGVKQHKLSENNGFPSRDYRLILKSSENSFPAILRMSFFEAGVDTVYETGEYLKSNENDIPAACFATRPEAPGWR